MSDVAAELRALAQAATPGPWGWVEPHAVRHLLGPEFGSAEEHIAAIEGLFSKRHANGAYIAHLSPDVALRLADVLDAAEHCLGMTKDLRAALDRLAEAWKP